MDSGQHFYAPALAVYAVGGGLPETLIAGAIGAAPDIVGAYGNIVKKDNYSLYNKAHEDWRITAGIIFGLILSMRSMLAIPLGRLFYYEIAFALGCFGYSLHLALDLISHGDGKRWWMPKERLWLNTAIWLALCILTLLINPFYPIYAIIGAAWASVVTATCLVKYKE